MVHKKKEIKAYRVNRTTVVFAGSLKEAKEIYKNEHSRQVYQILKGATSR
jgi:hypothetical protein